MLNNITPIILTFNEEANIERTLQALTWARCIFVIDSFSSDHTEKICRSFDNVTFIQRAFDTHAEQWNFGLNQDINSEWVLALDADHVVSPSLIDELSGLEPVDDINGYWASFTYVISAKPLKRSLYPPVLSLYRRNGAHYFQDGHTQRIRIEGRTEQLHHKIFHDDRKKFNRWIKSQWSYAKQEAVKLDGKDQKSANPVESKLGLPDRLRKFGLAPLVIMPYILIFKGMIFEGLPGITYSVQRFIAEITLQVARLTRLLK